MASHDKAIESYKKAITTAASVMASLMLVRSVVNEVVPYEVREMFFSGIGYLRSHMSSQHTIIVEKKNDGFTHNHIYNAVKTYLATRINTDMQQRLRVSSLDENDKMMVSMAEGEEMVDVYDGAEFKWCLVFHDNLSDSNNGNSSQKEAHSFEVTFHRKHKEKALKSYIPFILATAKAIKAQERTLRIYMTEYSDEWSPIDLQHPSTFDTLAMDQKRKQSIIDDLDRFVKRKDYYKKIGKAWKRGYLLYGPPGTGKSSLIAAMANHLRFDIYDLELTEVRSNSDLRRLLVGMSNRSILVVEDIDCTIELKQREEGEAPDKSESTEENKGEDKVTLSGLLNFVDGLWSTTGEERIIVFTTNYKERLDSALLRPGRMDMHIHMGYCTPESFRVLANNYHSIDYDATYPEVEELIKQVEVTPAEVAEVLMRNDNTDIALHELVDFLLYGPPGTGKSSLIAAMANYLKFDIYDLELTEVKCNSDLRRLLVGMSNRSILVVEDIDCSIELQQREEGEKRARSSAGEENDDKVTLSGLLNFVDGLWSTSGEERIIVFTTNYRERLDPALLRPGRMDMHIHMGYCTPAEVAEVLMRNDNSDLVLQDLIEFLQAKREGAGESKASRINQKHQSPVFSFISFM